MIIPTVGRVVWYRPNHADGIIHLDPTHPLAAMIACVLNERLVNLTVFDSNGTAFSRRSVPLLQDGDAASFRGPYCEWMPYQKGQAAKTEILATHAEVLRRQLGEKSP